VGEGVGVRAGPASFAFVERSDLGKVVSVELKSRTGKSRK